MFPGKNDAEIAEEIATYFNSISQEYPPLPDPEKEWDKNLPDYIEAYEISSRLRNFRKPKSTVKGDINPKLVTEFCDLLAIPLHYIFNQTLHALSWPELWKSETVHAIPKNAAPSDVSEPRNLSCTPLF